MSARDARGPRCVVTRTYPSLTGRISLWGSLFPQTWSPPANDTVCFRGNKRTILRPWREQLQVLILAMCWQDYCEVWPVGSSKYSRVADEWLVSKVELRTERRDDSAVMLSNTSADVVAEEILRVVTGAGVRDCVLWWLKAKYLLTELDSFET